MLYFRGHSKNACLLVTVASLVVSPYANVAVPHNGQHQGTKDVVHSMVSEELLSGSSAVPMPILQLGGSELCGW